MPRSSCSDAKITHTIIKRKGTKIGIMFQTLPQHTHITATTMPYMLARLQKKKFHSIPLCTVVGPQLKTVKLCAILHGPQDTIFSWKTVYKILLHLVRERCTNMTLKGTETLCSPEGWQQRLSDHSWKSRNKALMLPAIDGQ
jgi:hypothetical protein